MSYERNLELKVSERSTGERVVFVLAVVTGAASAVEMASRGVRSVTRRHLYQRAPSASLRPPPRPARRPSSGIRTSDAPRDYRGSVYVRPLAAEDESPCLAPHSAYYAVATVATAWTFESDLPVSYLQCVLTIRLTCGHFEKISSDNFLDSVEKF